MSRTLISRRSFPNEPTCGECAATSTLPYAALVTVQDRPIGYFACKYEVLRPSGSGCSTNQDIRNVFQADIWHNAYIPGEPFLAGCEYGALCASKLIASSRTGTNKRDAMIAGFSNDSQSEMWKSVREEDQNETGQKETGRVPGTE
jgi:hypothetical protein